MLKREKIYDLYAVGKGLYYLNDSTYITQMLVFYSYNITMRLEKRVTSGRVLKSQPSKFKHFQRYRRMYVRLRLSSHTPSIYIF